jgi:hypothetical protein
MDKESDIFYEEYAIESSTDTLSKPPKKKERKKQQNQTVSGQIDYDKSKPYRVTIKAREIKQ